MPNCLIDPTDTALPVEAIHEQAYDAWRAAQSAGVQSWLSSIGFKGKGGQTAVLPGAAGAAAGAVYIIGGNEERGGLWAWSGLRDGLAGGEYRIVSELSAEEADDAAMGFALAASRFDRYQ